MNEAAFLTALHADPADAVAWLALADFLDEAGQPHRAELLRTLRTLLALPPMEATPERSALEQRLTPLLAAGTRPVVPEVVNSIGMRFALIPPGRFRMGTPHTHPGHHKDEFAHEVRLSRAFYLGTFPVTQRQYERVMGHNPSSFRREGDEAGTVAGLDTSEFPVESVSWNDAIAFCERLSETLGEIRAGHVYRLPTEAEWEYACRAGTTTAFHHGDTLSPSLANFEDLPMTGTDNLGRPCPVGSYPSNAFGLYDMHGNVYEWCQDFYAADTYRKSKVDDPRGPPTGNDHPLRGGSWYADAGFCRSAWRDFNEPDAQLYINGFRVVMQKR